VEEIMNASWRLGRLGPLLLTLNYTWLLVGGLGLWILALLWLPAYLGSAPAWLPWLLAGLIIVLYGVGLVLAEGVRTRLAGIFSARWPRQVHLFPFGAAAAFTPQALSPRRAMTVAIAQPLVLAALAALCAGVAAVGQSGLPGPVLGTVRALALAFGGAAALNVLPGIPLAGGWFLAALRGWLTGSPDGGVSLARRLGLVVALGLAAVGAGLVIVGGDWVPALGLLALAWAIREGGGVVERRTVTRHLLEQLTAAEVMQLVVAPVRPDQNLAEIFWRQQVVQTQAAVPVADSNGRFAGLLPTALADQLLQGTWPTTPVQSVMIPAADLPTIQPTTRLPEVMAAFARRVPAAPAAPAGPSEAPARTATFLPVMDKGRILGVITQDQLEEYERLGANVGVQEASALQALTSQTPTRMAWAGVVVAFVLATALLANLGNRVVGPTLAAEVTPTPVPKTAITFSDITPADGTIIGRGDVPIRVTVDTPGPVTQISVTFDGDPLPATADPPGATYFTVSATAPAYLLGLHNVEVRIETEQGLSNRTQWYFRVAMDAPAPTGGTPPPDLSATPGAPAAPAPVVAARYPAAGGLLPTGDDTLTAWATLTGAPTGVEWSLDGTPLAAQVQPDTPQAGMSRISAPLGALTPGAHTLTLTVAAGEPVKWEFTVIPADDTHRFFPQTGYFVTGAFLAFWEQHGGLDIFGYPLGDPQVTGTGDTARTEQYFERARMEQPGSGPIELGLLGLAVHPPDPAVAALPDARYFTATGHNLAAPFQAYWEAHGGLPIFGYPISEAGQEDVNGTPTTVQYFERVRMEDHPENAGTPWEVILSPLGRQILAAQP
jgi:hypothetical protein